MGLFDFVTHGIYFYIMNLFKSLYRILFDITI